MKPKQKYTLRLKNPLDVEKLSSSTSAPTQKKQKRHNSHHQEKENRKKMEAKKKEIEEAVTFLAPRAPYRRLKTLKKSKLGQIKKTQL